MSQIGSVDSAASQTLAAASAESGNASAEPVKLGLPPTGLVRAAAANTVNAQLATSQLGVDPASVGGVYGGSSQSAGLLSNGSLLPLLQSLSPTTAEQALALTGVSVPRAGSASSAAAAAGSAALASAQAAFGGGTADSSPVAVDPLWGRTA